MSTFIFKDYTFNEKDLTAKFHYSFDDEREFTEMLVFSREEIEYNSEALERALFLAFILIGASYYKSFPSRKVEIYKGVLDQWQVGFLNKVYQEGLSQFAFENNLTRSNLAIFQPAGQPEDAVKYDGDGILSLQSGGKDSLLTATQLHEQNKQFSSFYISSSELYPDILNKLHSEVILAQRHIDISAIKKAISEGGLNGHGHVTYIVMSIALLQAILLNKATIFTSIGHEGEEPHEWIEDLPVNHQWSKTWPAEQIFAEYVAKYISPDIRIGSPLRQYSELRIAELFVENAWEGYGHSFSSCNRANYEQGADNTTLKWCGDCPKCANSFLLFAPFLEATELKSVFHGQDLFAKPSLCETFKGLLGVEGVMKPFECVGEIDELRLAYHKAQTRGRYETLPFPVPESDFDYLVEYPAQSWAKLN